MSQTIEVVILWLIFIVRGGPVQAELISVSASGTISKSNSAETTIPLGTPWTFEIIYDTAAPDLDELTNRRSRRLDVSPTLVPYSRDLSSLYAANYEVTIRRPEGLRRIQRN
jgi:hypothetical protein